MRSNNNEMKYKYWEKKRIEILLRSTISSKFLLIVYHMAHIHCKNARGHHCRIQERDLSLIRNEIQNIILENEEQML